MAEQYEMNISLLSYDDANAQPSPMYTGTVTIQIDSGTASGSLNLTGLSAPIPFNSTKVSYDAMPETQSTYVAGAGSNSNESVDLAFFLIENDLSNILYLGGMANLLSDDEWLPYILTGAVQLTS
jgi:hypothetical protein